MTLQDLIDIIEADAGLSKVMRTSRSSQLRTFSRVVGLPPTTLPATVPFLRDALAKANPGVAGLSRDYWV